MARTPIEILDALWEKKRAEEARERAETVGDERDEVYESPQEKRNRNSKKERRRKRRMMERMYRES